MQRLTRYLSARRRLIVGGIMVIAGLLFVMLYRLGNLANGLAQAEVDTVNTPLGLHGIYGQTFFVPLLALRAIVFHIVPGFGFIIARLPNVFFGILSVAALTLTLRLWLGARSALFSGILFALSAWTLHVSRLASMDVMYLWTMCALLLSAALLHNYADRRPVFFATLFLLGSLVYTPGAIWLVLVLFILQRADIADGFRALQTKKWKVTTGLAFLIWLPLLAAHLIRIGGVRQWLGLPSVVPSLHELAKNFAGVFIHIFIRGPEYGLVWLGRAPLLDAFVLVTAVLGIIFYIRHPRAGRSKLLAALTTVTVLLITIGPPQAFSLIVPLLYVAATTGIGFLLREWLRTFPENPVARNTAIGLICVLVGLSSVYTLRSYFIAWPNNLTTQALFRYHR